LFSKHPIIVLDEEHYIAEGHTQKCYKHPEHKNLCIKIVKYNPSSGSRNIHEIDYYEKLKKKHKKYAYPFYSKYYGTVNTNLGNGYIFDLIRDIPTNEISLTLCDYLKMKNAPFSDDLLTQELDRLKKMMIEYKVVARDLYARNICCKVISNTSIKLVIIDGMGHRDFIPLVDYFSFFTKLKIERIFEKKKLNSLNEYRKYLTETDTLTN